MFFVYNIPNLNPALGPVKGDSQAVSVYDRDLGNRRTVITTPEEADEFVQARKDAIQSGSKKGCALGLATTAAGAGIGAAANYMMEQSKATTINGLIDKLNPEYKAIYEAAKAKHIAQFKSTHAFSGMMERANLLAKDAYKKFDFELRKLFSADNNSFTKIDVAKAAKKGLKAGALIGGAIALCFGLFLPAIKAESADKRITKEFIENNK